MTILHVSTLAAFCLMLTGLCRWTSRFPSEAVPTEERFRSLFEHAAVAMSIVDSDKQFVHVNLTFPVARYGVGLSFREVFGIEFCDTPQLAAGSFIL